ncbi:hypothetical protein P7C70_g782, partial [Phenoliferia sp. Uapishka_3]
MTDQSAPYQLAPAPFPPLELFRYDHSVLGTLAKEPKLAPGAAARRLFPKPWFGARLYRRMTIKHDLLHGRVWTPQELDDAAERGDFPYRPSDLFLNMYADVLTCLTRRPLAGNISPALLGTSGTIPLSIVSTIPDIMRHYYDTIVLAEKEVFLVTSEEVLASSDSLVPGSSFSLPQIIGTAKAARKLLSRQYQDVVDAEHADEVTPRMWWRRVAGDNDAASQTPPPSSGANGGFASLVSGLVQKMREEKARAAGETIASPSNPTEPTTTTRAASDVTAVGTVEDVAIPAVVLAREDPVAAAESTGNNNSHPTSLPSPVGASHLKQLSASSLAAPASPTSFETPSLTAPSFQGGARLLNNPSNGSTSRLAALSKALNAGALSKVEATIDDERLIDDFKPHMIHKTHKPFRASIPQLNLLLATEKISFTAIALVNRGPHGSPGHQDVRVAQDAAWLAGFRYAAENVFIQTPTLNAKPIVRAIIEACTSGGKDGRGLEVTLFLDLGFNDKGESVPYQGGTNEEVVVRLYDALRPRKKEHNLHVYWYTEFDWRGRHCGRDVREVQDHPEFESCLPFSAVPTTLDRRSSLSFDPAARVLFLRWRLALDLIHAQAAGGAYTKVRLICVPTQLAASIPLRSQTLSTDTTLCMTAASIISNSSTESGRLSRPPRSSRRPSIIERTRGPSTTTTVPSEPIASTSKLTVHKETWASSPNRLDIGCYPVATSSHSHLKSATATAAGATTDSPTTPQADTGLQTPTGATQFHQQSRQTSQPASPTSSRSTSPSLPRSFSPLPRTPLQMQLPRKGSGSPLYALHEPPILLPHSASHSPLQSRSGSHFQSPHQTEQDGQNPAGAHLNGSDTHEDSGDESEWSGVELPEEEVRPRSDFLQRSLGFEEPVPREEFRQDERKSSVQTPVGAELPTDTTPTPPWRTGEVSPTKRRGSSARLSGVDTDYGANPWWTSSSSILASAGDINQDRPKSSFPTHPGAPSLITRPSQIGLAFDRATDVPDHMPGRGKLTKPLLSTYQPSPPSSHTSPRMSSATNQSDPNSYPFAHAPVSPTGSNLSLNTPPSPVDYSQVPQTAPLRLVPRSNPQSPSPSTLPTFTSAPMPSNSITAAPRQEFVEEEALSQALHEGLDSLQRATARPSHEQEMIESRAESSASSVYSSSSGLVSPVVELRPLAPVISDTLEAPPPLSTPASNVTARDADLLPTVTPVTPLDIFAPPPQLPSTQSKSIATTVPNALSSPAELPISPTPFSAFSTKRRQLKPEPKAPILNPKSDQRKTGVARLVSSDSIESLSTQIKVDAASVTIPSIQEEEKFDTVSPMDHWVEGSRPTSRPREVTPLSASDFADVYGAFDHSPSAYDAEFPETHKNYFASTAGPASPPNPVESPSPVDYATPSTAVNGGIPRFPSPIRSEIEKLTPRVASDTRRVSEGFSDETDAFQGAVSRASSDEDGQKTAPVHQTVTAQLAATATAIPARSSSPMAGKGDSKARALAFIADLKRAKLAQASRDNSPQNSSPRNSSPVPSPLATPNTLPPSFITSPISTETTTPFIQHDREASEITSTPLPSPPSPATILAAETLPPKPSLPTIPNPASRATPLSPAPTTRSSALSAREPSPQVLERLTRTRLLPEPMRYRDLRSVKSARERAHLYALKINALAKEDAGTAVWIGFVRGGHSPLFSEGPTSPIEPHAKSRKSREDVSTASSVAFPIRGDSYRLKEITTGSFSPHDLTPTVPYPGVLHLARSSKPAAIAKSGFFSLGRKSSLRRGPDGPPQRYSGGSPLGAIPSPPIASPSSAPSTVGRSSLSGPRMPGTPGNRALRGASYMSFTQSPPSEPASVLVDLEALGRLGDILPMASKETLSNYLSQAGNDETLAISLYLADQQQQSR